MLMDLMSEKLVVAAILLAAVAAFAVLRGLLRRLTRAGASSAELAEEPAAPARAAPLATRRRGLMAAQPEEDGPPAPAPMDVAAAATLLLASADEGLPPPAHEGPLPHAVEAARWRPIVFRTLRPEGPGRDGLSFYGGQPIGPADFRWPRSGGSEGVPLTFLMQWDCAQLARCDATGLMPRDGVLYCFCDLSWGGGDEGARIEAFLHHPGPTAGWAEIPVPADAPPIFGSEGAHQAAGCTARVEDADAHVPRTMPRFPFMPVAFDYPRGALAEAADEEGDRLFWSERLTGEALLEIARQGRPDAPAADLPQSHPGFARPFPAFPHDFAAVRVLAAKMIKDAEYRGRGYRSSDMAQEERQALAATCLGEAKELYRLGCQRPMETPLDQAIADDIWQWLERRRDFVSGGTEGVALDAVDLSLGVGSRALGRVPAEWIDKAMRRHDLASEYIAAEHYDREQHGDWDTYRSLRDAGELPRVRNVHAPVPAHIFGPPSYVQGYVEEYMDDHLLLLELTSGSGPEHSFGEGVLQYLIRPEDLAAGRFDKVASVISAY